MLQFDNISSFLYYYKNANRFHYVLVNLICTIDLATRKN